ncbi:MAG: hypothetical protein U0133_14180 [Gemmatimonadales bacterium]
MAIGVALGLVAGCGGKNRPSTTPDPRIPTEVLPASKLYFLEMSGIPPEDSVVTFAVAERRVIILRHGAPDNTVFAELTFPDSVFWTRNGPDSVTVVVRPRPGLYAMDLAMTVIPARGATIKFKYPVHFEPPRDAVTRYGSLARFEQALAVGMLADGTNFALLPSLRPASDNLEAALPGPGTYMVAAPRDVSR